MKCQKISWVIFLSTGAPPQDRLAWKERDGWMAKESMKKRERGGREGRGKTGEEKGGKDNISP